MPTIHFHAASWGPNGFGAWAYRVVEDDRIVAEESMGKAAPTTEQRMQLDAVLAAFRNMAYVPGPLVVRGGGSAYVTTALSDWILKWEIAGWRKTDGKPLQHLPEWQELNALRNARADAVSAVHIGNRKPDLHDLAVREAALLAGLRMVDADLLRRLPHVDLTREPVIPVPVVHEPPAPVIGQDAGTMLPQWFVGRMADFRARVVGSSDPAVRSLLPSLVKLMEPPEATTATVRSKYIDQR